MEWWAIDTDGVGDGHESYRVMSTTDMGGRIYGDEEDDEAIREEGEREDEERREKEEGRGEKRKNEDVDRTGCMTGEVDSATSALLASPSNLLSTDAVGQVSKAYSVAKSARGENIDEILGTCTARAGMDESSAIPFRTFQHGDRWPMQ